MAMVMAMDTMDNNKFQFLERAVKLSFIAILSCFYCPAIYALDWKLTPSLSFREIYSDNLNLQSSGNKESGLVTELSPGFSLFGISPKDRFNLSYRMQNLYNAGGESNLDVNHQLQFDSLYQIVSNRLYLESQSSMSQQNTNNNLIATDNISGNSDRTSVSTFSISPYWTPKFGDYATGLVKVQYETVNFDNTDSGNDPAVSTAVSNSNTYGENISLSSGREFRTVNWNLNFSNQDQIRDDGDNIAFQNSSALIRGIINRKFNVFTEVGYANNDFQDEISSNTNGLYYTFGGQWRPSVRYSIEVGVGNNSHVTVTANPFSNLNGAITYQHKDIGTNTGDSWQSNFNYRTNKAVMNFTYVTDTTTTQQILSDQQVFTSVDSFGQTIIDPVTNQPAEYNTSNPNLVDDVIVRKSGNLSYSYRTGKSTFNANLLNERRNYQLSGNRDDVWGISGSWNWQAVSRTNIYLRPEWQHTKTTDTKTDRYDFSLGVNRNIPVNISKHTLMQGQLEYRYINQISDQEENDYIENRFTASLFLTF
jgi:hypothetical protein